MDKEKRRQPRVESLNLIAYVCKDNDGNVSAQGMGRTLNVSEIGVLLETYYPIECKNLLLIDIGFKDELVDLKGKIIHSKTNRQGKHETGIEFVDIDENTLKILHQYIKAFQELYPES